MPCAQRENDMKFNKKENYLKCTLMSLEFVLNKLFKILLIYVGYGGPRKLSSQTKNSCLIYLDNIQRFNALFNFKFSL